MLTRAFHCTGIFFTFATRILLRPIKHFHLRAAMVAATFYGPVGKLWRTAPWSMPMNRIELTSGKLRVDTIGRPPTCIPRPCWCGGWFSVEHWTAT